jgi:hypothetical protein
MLVAARRHASMLRSNRFAQRTVPIQTLKDDNALSKGPNSNREEVKFVQTVPIKPRTN